MKKTTTSPKHPRVWVDADLVDWFKGKGRCYQAKINQVLRTYIKEHEKAPRN
ncbi:MAG: BrnA antitoxin family protein [Planctomycetaceae bacterium]|nr:BrnA antitoxin family protein [Planctomycetaceae bacterium]